MATTTIPWGDGSGDNLYFSADAMEGNQEVLVSSDANAGSERSKTVTFSAQGAEPKSLGIIQLGSGGTSEFDDWVKDGDTHLWINIVNDYQKEQHIRIKMKGTIDWGDGSTKDTANVTAYTTFTHTYADKGRYRIDLHPTSGTFEIGGAAYGYNVMGERSNSTYFRTSALYQAELGSSLITKLTQYAFHYCVGVRRVFIPKNVTSAEQQAFGGASSLAYLEFEDATKLTSWSSSNVFYNCYALQSLGGATPDWGTSISSTVRNCYSLVEFTISSGVTSIPANGMGALYGLQHLYCLPSTPPTCAAATSLANLNPNCVIHVPNGKLSSYQSANIWSTYASQMVEMPAA